MSGTTHPDGGSRSAGPLLDAQAAATYEVWIAAFHARLREADRRELETLRDALAICQARGYTFAAKALRSAILRFVRENDL